MSEKARCECIEFSIPMTPVAKGRPIVTRSGHAFTPAKTRNAEATIKQFAVAAAGDRPYPVFGDSAVEVSLQFVFARPKSRRSEVYKTTRPDVDNSTKLVCDAQNGIMWKDDSQVVFLTASKVWGESPAVNIKIWRLENGTK